MQRMYEEKRMQMERGSIGGSYFMVQLPDGTMEKRLKAPLNADPGVHSSLALDQLAAQQGGMHAVATLPTITESKVQEQNGSSNSSSESSQIEMKKPLQKKRNTNSESDANEYGSNNLPRNASQPAFTSHQSGTIELHVALPGTLVWHAFLSITRYSKERIRANVRPDPQALNRWKV